MLPPFDPWRTAALSAEALWGARAPAAWRRERSRERLRVLLRLAQARSPFWRRRLHGIRGPGDLAQVPALRKAELMAHFDEAVTDPALRLAELRRFTADPGRIADPFMGRYVVWESSGSSGEPGMYVQDTGAMAVYDTLEALRRPDWARWASPAGWSDTVVFVGATDGHFAGVVSFERLRRLNPLSAPRLHRLSFLQRPADLARQLARLDPTVIATYPTAAVMLADERLAGRLRVRPRAVWTGGETLTPGMRAHVQQAFGCPVHDSYGASEFLTLASACRHGRLHLNDDWALLESVDAEGRPVAEGTAGHTTLLTNLANLVQPLIRYDLGDRVTLRGPGCACGGTLPVVEVQGRCDETLRVAGADGRALHLLPLALTTVLEDQAQVFDFQLVRLDERTLELRLGHGDEAAGQRALQALQAFLLAQGAPQVSVRVRRDRLPETGRSGKRPRVIAQAVQGDRGGEGAGAVDAL